MTSTVSTTPLQPGESLTARAGSYTVTLSVRTVAGQAQYRIDTTDSIGTLVDEWSITETDEEIARHEARRAVGVLRRFGTPTLAALELDRLTAARACAAITRSEKDDIRLSGAIAAIEPLTHAQGHRTLVTRARRDFRAMGLLGGAA